MLASVPLAVTADGAAMTARAICYFSTPTDGETVSGTIDIIIVASKRPYLYLDGSYVGKGYTWTWDTIGADGAHSLRAVCFGVSQTIYITVERCCSTTRRYCSRGNHH